ncbi:DUF11 domain-containing protein [Deinococcus sp. HMF7604]|uniref:beta strand repeat-containing protein n=1 Tax=Deinococcus betulae TaxID=2873312 RepID=UPI001CC96E2B|nr:DUF11 domain-containing protein [Deinococcus betulae]MBZ9750776.1 DUF11 domain-containing protein [Deinococcus betulae]
MKGLVSRLSRLAVVGLGMAALGSTAQAAASYCTAIYSAQTTPTISGINPANGELIKSVSGAGEPNAIAINPIDGLVYFFDRGTTPPTLYRINPAAATPTAVAVGQMTNNGTDFLVGATFTPAGGLITYWSSLTIRTVNITTRTFGAAQNITGSDIVAGTNGDIAYDSSGQLWAISNPATGAALYKLTPSGTTYAATKYVTISGTSSSSINGLAINAVTGLFYLSSNGSLYGLDGLGNATPSGAATLKGSIAGVTDLASCGTVPNTPTATKAFSPSTIQSPATTSTLTINVENSNLAPYYLFANIVDTMPTGMTVNTGSLGGTCDDNGNTLTATTGAITLAKGATIPVGGCTITATVNVANTPGSYTNTIAANSVQGSTGTLTTITSATLVSQQAPTITKAFSPASVALNGTSTITFTVTNGNPGSNPALTNLNFTDTLTGMRVASTAIGGTCTSVTNSPALAVGATALNLTIPSLAAASSCTVTVQVEGTQIGVNPNTASGVNSTETPTRGAASGTVNLTVRPLAPVVTKSFSPATVAQGGTTQLTINVSNPNGVAATGFTLTDDIATTTGVTGLTITAVGTDTCKGTGTVTTTNGKYTLTGGTLPTGGCSVVLTVQVPSGATVGAKTNTILGSSVTGTINGQSLPPVADATATLTVTPVVDLAITKTGPATAFQGAAVTYTIRAWNNGPSAVTGATISDTVPANLTSVSWTCVATGTATCGAASGTGNSISLGANLPVDTGSAATADTNYVTLTVTGTAATNGTVTNTAAIAAPGGVTETVTANNSASVQTVVSAQIVCSNLYGLVGGDFTTNNNGTDIRVIGDTDNVLGALIATVPQTGGGVTGYSATLAIKPDRSKFFVVRDADSRLLSFDVATNTWTEGQALPTPTGRYIRMAVTSNDVGYVMDGAGNLFSFTTTATPAYTALPALTKLPASAPALGASGDFFADNRGNLFLLSSTGADGFLDFWEIEPANNNLVYLGRLSDADIVGTYGGFGATPNGLFGRGGSGRMINVDLRAFTATPVGTANNGATDLASCTFPSLTRTISAIKTATRVGGGTTVQPGDTLEYTITVKNTGTVAAGNTQFLDQIPAGTTYVAGTTTLNGTAVTDATGGVMPYTQSGQPINSPGQQVGSLLVDQTPADTTDREAIIKFRVTVNTANPPTQVSNQGAVSTRDNGAVLTAVTDDPATATANDATVTTVTPVAVLDLAITKAGPAFAKAGEAFAYTITVTNTTATPSTTVTVTDILPTGLTFVSATNSGSYNAGTRTVTWTLASVAGNASTVLTLNVTAPAAATISPAAGVKSAQNTASLSATGDTNAANNTSAPVTTRFVLNEITKRVRNVTTNSAFGTSGGGKPGEVLEYCLDTTNLGGADLPGYALTDQVPGNVNALTTAYDADEPTTATGFGVRVARTTAGVTTTTYRTSVADGDTGTLTTTGGTFSRGTMTLGLGTLLAGESVTACFQATIR